MISSQTLTWFARHELMLAWRDWASNLVLAMAWSVGVLTLGGSSLLYLLIQRGEATAVAVELS